MLQRPRASRKILREPLMRNCCIVVTLLTAACYCTHTRAQARDADILATLRAGHPRLIILDADLPAIKRAAQEDPGAKVYYTQFQKTIERNLKEPVAEHKLIGPRLLG